MRAVDTVGRSRHENIYDSVVAEAITQVPDASALLARQVAVAGLP